MTTAASLARPGAPIEPDLLLLQRFIDTGDPDSFAEIVQRYARVVYSASLRILGDQGRAQDVSQETFYRLMRSPRVVTHSLAGWLHRTATHLALDVRRSEKSRKRREQSYGQQFAAQLQQHPKAPQPTWTELSPYVDQALNDVEEPTRGLLIRHFLQGVQQADLAIEMDVSAATVSRRIKTGLEQLQTALRKKGIYLSVALLAGFCATHTDAAVPVALVTEMAKMNLIASLRQLPVTPPPPRGPFHTPYQMSSNLQIFLPEKFTAAMLCLSVIIAGYLFLLLASQMRTNPAPTPPSLEPIEMHHDR
jgi:RNA polymerase sigma factor (sigma-70 family)